MRAYYNDHDKDVCRWLEQLIKNGDITKGDVDDRSITDIKPDDIAGYDRVHLFAGIGTWDYALNQAGWGDKPVLTASLPCQPFSAAGKGLGKQDERHLLPHFLELVRRCKPKTIFGEQVERAIGSTGLRDQTQDVQSLQTRAAYLRVLAELQRQGGKTLQELQSMGEKQQTREEGEKFYYLSGLENEESRCRISEFRNSSSQRKRNGIGYNCGMGANKDRCGSMRGHRDIVRLSYAESVERAIIGQDRQQQRVHNNKYPCGDLCLECDDEYLGTAEDIGSIEWNNESAQEQINRAYRKVSEQVERAIAHGWLDDLQTIMEAEGYAVGHCVLGAHSVNAAHIRQRLYWVANAVNDNCQRTIRRINGQEGRVEVSNGEDIVITGQSGGTGNNVLRLCHSERERLEGFAGDENSLSRQERGYPGQAGSVTKTGSNSRLADSNGAGSFKGRESSEVARYRDSIESNGGDNINWLWCRDNKYRPIKSGSIKMAHGVARGMVCCCNSGNEAKEKKINATEEKANPREVLPALLQENGEKEDKFQTGGLVSIQETEILRKELHGECVQRGNESKEFAQCAQAIIEDGGEILRGVWEDTHVTCSSCGRKRYEQRSIEFDDIVRSMPQGSTLETFFCARGSEFMQTLRKTGDEKRSLLDTQYSLSEIWRSFDDESKERVRVHFDQRAWLIERDIRPLVENLRGNLVEINDPIQPNFTQEARQMRLKGYGNAIQAQTAEMFIRAYMG